MSDHTFECSLEALDIDMIHISPEIHNGEEMFTPTYLLCINNKSSDEETYIGTTIRVTKLPMEVTHPVRHILWNCALQGKNKHQHFKSRNEVGIHNTHRLRLTHAEYPGFLSAALSAMYPG
jgi:hypothetical protein